MRRWGMVGEEVHITFGGDRWAALRPDQKALVQQMMLSWRAVGGREVCIWQTQG